jgi:hypothetical protein
MQIAQLLNLTALASMYPLLRRDMLLVPYLFMSVLARGP